jgi:single-stranded-DNA-specific exonuclease
LLITVDNGSNATEALAKARELGMRVVVTDHHSVNTDSEYKISINTIDENTISENRVNQGVILVNPNLPSDPYVFGGLSGVGVIWKVARELLASCGKAAKAWDFLDLVALGTIADVSPLVDENRILVKLGLQILNQNPRPGLRELIKRQLPKRESPGSDPISAYEVGMYLAPCLNAAGRIGDVQEAVELLLSRDETEASRLAQSLVDLNQERKRITEQGIEAAQTQLAGVADLPNIICLPLLNLDESICGLVAGRIKEVYNRPTLVFTRSSEAAWKGSGRSIPQFDLTRLMHTVSHLVRGGGHPQACGFSLSDEQMEEFLQAVGLFGEQQIENRHFIKVIRVDLALEPHDITLDLYRELEKLQPFGNGWEEPIIGLRQIAVTGGPMGKNGEHLRLRCRQTGLVFKGWGQFNKYEWLGHPQFVDIIGKIRKNVWQGRESIEIEIVDFRVNIDNN